MYVEVVPSGWYVYNKVCHRRFVDEVKTFSEAKAVCASHGATLATAKSMEDVEFLFDLGDKDGDYIWLGLSKNSGGQWMWEDGTALSWSNWKSVVFFPGNGWNPRRARKLGQFLLCMMMEMRMMPEPIVSQRLDLEYKNACYKFHPRLHGKLTRDAGAACSAYGEGVTLTTAKDEGEFKLYKINYRKHAYFHSEDSLPSLAPLRIPLGSKLVKDDIVRDLVFESTEKI
nr:hypothetical protein BaRGS_018531 [Batillaria attramentaria]